MKIFLLILSIITLFKPTFSQQKRADIRTNLFQIPKGDKYYTYKCSIDLFERSPQKNYYLIFFQQTTSRLPLELLSVKAPYPYGKDFFELSGQKREYEIYLYPNRFVNNPFIYPILIESEENEEALGWFLKSLTNEFYKIEHALSFLNARQFRPLTFTEVNNKQN